ncbi:MAG TPA: anti-sigma factor antagonist [Desulfobacteraceae bacterium]|nr:anti-sigma factor antagonist [Desulfobacteraceae bacterium]
MQMESEQQGDILVVIPMEPRLDAAQATDFKSAIVDRINDGHTRILLDLSHVDFMDSSGLGAMVSILKTIGRDGDLLLCGLGNTVESLFKLTRMNRVFRIFSTREEALQAISAQG